MRDDFRFSIISNLWVRQIVLEKRGDVEPGHKHRFDHHSLLAYGQLRVVVGGKSHLYDAPAMIHIEKDKIHEFIAEADNTIVYCVHPLRGSEQVGDILPPKPTPEKYALGRRLIIKS